MVPEAVAVTSARASGRHASAVTPPPGTSTSCTAPNWSTAPRSCPTQSNARRYGSGWVSHCGRSRPSSAAASWRPPPPAASPEGASAEGHMARRRSRSAS
eukprot:533858-Prorocentrum_minimum.AAC.2